MWNTDVKKIKDYRGSGGGRGGVGIAWRSLVMASDSTATPTTTHAAQSNSLFAKAAALLGVTEQQLTVTYQQANTQAENHPAIGTGNDKSDNHPSRADAITAWLTQKPTAPTKDSLKAWQDSQPKLTNPDALIWPFCSIFAYIEPH
jgi:hypothetical protein